VAEIEYNLLGVSILWCWVGFGKVFEKRVDGDGRGGRYVNACERYEAETIRIGVTSEYSPRAIL